MALDETAARRLRRHLDQLTDLLAAADDDAQHPRLNRPLTVVPRRATTTDAPAPIDLNLWSIIGPGDYLAHPDPHNDQIGTPPARAIIGAWCLALTGQPGGIPQLLAAHTQIIEHPDADQFAGDVAQLHAALSHTVGSVEPGWEPLAAPCRRCNVPALGRLLGNDPECENCHAIERWEDYQRRADAVANVLAA